MANTKAYILFILIVLLGNLTAYSQRQSYIDSLETTLLKANDTKKIEIYNNLSWAVKFSNPSLAFDYGQKAYTLSLDLNQEKNEAISLNRMASAKLNLGELNTALELLLKSVSLSEKRNQQQILGTSLRQIGKVYEAQGNMPEAMKYYYNALGIADSLGLAIKSARAALNIGGLYIKINNYKTASRYLAYAIEEFEKDNYLRGLHQAYVLKGNYYQYQNKLDSALISYQKALGYLAQIKDKRGYAITTVKIAQVLESKGLYNDAIENYKLALVTFEQINDKKGVVNTTIYLAKSYAKNDNSKKGIFLAKSTLIQAQELQLPNEKKEAYYALYSIYKSNANKEKALVYLESYMFLMDSLKQGQESWKADQMRKSHELEIQVKENELNKAIIINQELTISNNTLVRNFLIVLVLLAIILAAIIWYALKHSNKANERLTIANEEKNEAISLISHDLKSPFNKIKGLAHLLELQIPSLSTADKDIITKINFISHEGLSLVQNLVDIKALNSDSYALKYSSFNLYDFLLKRVENFEQLAKSKHITLSLNQKNKAIIVYSESNSIARIFDNLFSNALKFSENGEIITDIIITENQFSFSISDKGIGISNEDINTIFEKYNTGKSKPTGTEISSGLGLTIVSSLVKKLGGIIECKSTLGEGSVFTVTLPRKKEEF